MSRLRFFVGEAWEYLLRGRGTTLSSIIALTAVLFLLALVLLVTHNVELLAGGLQARKGLTVFLAEGVSEERARAVEERLAGFGEVAEVRLVDREEALAEVEQDLGGFSVTSALGENPLPHSLVVALTPAAAAEAGVLQALAAEIRSIDDVDDVVFGDEWIEMLDRNLRTLSTATFAVGALAAISVFVVLLTSLGLVFVSRR